MVWSRIGVAVLVFGLTTAPALADQRDRIISVTGTGQVSAEPDMATIQLGVTHQDREAARAMARAAEAASDILARVAEAGIASRDVQTSTVSLSPVWSNYRSSEAPPEILGFIARISISVRVRDLPNLGTVLDAAVQDGANDLGGIRFGFVDPDPLMNQARRAAVSDARAKAELLADAAGVTLGPLQSMSEQGGGPRPVAMEMAARSDAAIPIAAGEMTLSANVSMVYAIAD